MKTSCEIVKDILPLYHDNVCSAESRKLIEEHLEECQSCGGFLKDISDELTRPVNVIDETKPLKAIAAILKKAKLKFYLKGAAIAFIAFLISAIAINWLTQPVWPVPLELLQVTDVAQLSDGRIAFTLVIDGDRSRYQFVSTAYRDGSSYYRISRSLFRERDRTDWFPPPERRVAVDIAELNAWEQSRGRGIEISSFYIGTRSNAILVWEEGMELPVEEPDYWYSKTIPRRDIHY